jgi:hypothetical protein
MTSMSFQAGRPPMVFGDVVQEIRSIDAMKVLATVIAPAWRLISRGRMR